MIELVQRCRSCGTECRSSAACDACGEGPVGVWAPELGRYLSESEAVEIRRKNDQELAAKVRRERWLRCLKPALVPLEWIASQWHEIRSRFTKEWLSRFSADHPKVLALMLLVMVAVPLAALMFGISALTSEDVSAPVARDHETYLHTDAEAGPSPDIDPPEVDIAQAIRDNRLDQIETYLRSGSSPVYDGALETALEAGRFAAARWLLTSNEYRGEVIASWDRGPRFLAMACRRKAEPGEKQDQEEVIHGLASLGASPEEELNLSGENEPEVHKTARTLARENGLEGLLPANPRGWVPCRQFPVRSCLSRDVLSPAVQPDRIPPRVPVKANPGGTCHPENTRRSPEVGAGPFGYQFRLTPFAGYRLLAKGDEEIPGLDDGVLVGITDAEGYTVFVRMPSKIPDDGWIFTEAVGDLNGHVGQLFHVIDEHTKKPLSHVAYALESKPAGRIYFGFTDKDGLSAYAMDTKTGEVHITTFHGDEMGNWGVLQIEFKADVYGVRKGDYEKNLNYIEDLFRENAALILCLREKLAHRKGKGPVTHRLNHKTITWESPEDELEKAEALNCHLRACRAAFLTGNDRTRLAAEDLDHLGVCPHLDNRDLPFLRTIVASLDNADPRLRILEMKLQAITRDVSP